MWNRVILCHNSEAGKNDLRKSEIVDALTLAGIEAEYCAVDSGAFPSILDSAVDLIIAAGGDGTIGKVAKYIGGRDVPLGILPVGTANNIARSFGIYGAPHEVAEGWSPDRIFHCDIGLVSYNGKNRLLIESAGIGPVSDTIKEKAGGKYSGAKKLHAARNSLHAKFTKAEPFPATIRIDGEVVIDEPILGAEIMNIGFAGPGAEILPREERRNGELSVVVFLPFEREKALEWLEAPQSHSPPAAPRHGREVNIRWANALFHIDDKVPDPATPDAEGWQAATIRLDGTTVKLLAPGYYRR